MHIINLTCYNYCNLFGVSVDNIVFSQYHLSVINVCTAQLSFKEQHIDITTISAKKMIEELDTYYTAYQPKIIQIGYIATIEQVELLSQWLKKHKRDLQVFYQPYIINDVHHQITKNNIIDNIKTQLLSYIDILCLDEPHLKLLSGIYPLNWNSFHRAAQLLSTKGISITIIKHCQLDNTLPHTIDYCYAHDNQYWQVLPHTISQEIKHHSTLFMSFYTSLHTLALHHRDCFFLSRACIEQYVINKKNPYPIYYNPEILPEKINTFPQVLTKNHPIAAEIDLYSNPLQTKKYHFPTLSFNEKTLYPIVDSSAWVEKLLNLGITMIQLRIKNKPLAYIRNEIARANTIAQEKKAKLFINDYWQLAIEYRCYGVHLGQEDIETADLNQIEEKGLALGISTHGYYEYFKIQQYQPSYIAIGAIFSTKTKDMSDQIQGLHTLAHLIQLTHQIPVVAIGGIHLNNVISVLQCQVDAIAVVSAITQSHQLEQDIASFNQLLAKT